MIENMSNTGEEITNVSETRQRADDGDPIAQFRMGELYAKGELLGEDDQKAAMWYSKAALQGLADAQFALGSFYHRGFGVEKNENAAVSWYRQAAMQGHLKAQNNLGLIYLHGTDGIRDGEQAEFWIRKAANQGDSSAQNALGVMYADGLIVEKNFQVAVAWYRKSANQGNASGQYGLGVMYANGMGVERNYETAAALLLQSSEQGLAQAQYQLGILYINGLGVEKDFEEASIWLTKAGDQGLEEAQSIVSSLASIKTGLENVHEELEKAEEILRAVVGRVCLASTKEAPYCTILQALDNSVTTEEWLDSLPQECNLLHEVTAPIRGGSFFVQLYEALLQKRGYAPDSGSFSSVSPKIALELFLAVQDFLDKEVATDDKNTDEDERVGENLKVEEGIPARGIVTGDIGYLYVLANSAMPGLVKVGKTTRTPSERAAELSSATGLPSPFIVVYEQLFADCSAAESFVHTYLGQKGFRISENREFFNAPVNDVVRAIMSALEAVDNESHQTGSGEDDDMLEDDEEELYAWSSIFEDAENYYYGLGEYLQDYTEALRLYKQAAKLGSLPAYGRIGEIYERGEGVPQDQEKALNAYKQGAAKGSVYCYWALGILFLAKGKQENAEKCFSNFLKKFPAFTDEQYLTSQERTHIFMQAGYMVNGKLKYGIEYPIILNTFFSGEWAVSIVHHANEQEKHLRKNNRLDFANDYIKVIRYLESLQRLPEISNSITDSSAASEQKSGFFARLFS